MPDDEIDLDALLDELSSDCSPTNKPEQDPHRVIITDCDCGNQMTETLQRIAAAWKNSVTNLILDFEDINQMPPNPALRLYDLLKSKPPGTTITANAHSPIINCGCLLWLAADRRYIRPTGWMFFRRLNTSARRQRKRGDIFDDEPWRGTDDDQARPDFTEMDYRRVLELINQYLPTKDFANKVITPALLDEFCLLDIGLMKMDKVSACGSKQGAPASIVKDTRHGQPGGNHLAEKLTWFVERNPSGNFTLKGGHYPSAMAMNASLRNEGLPVEFSTKDELVAFLKRIRFCEHKDKVVMDGHQILLR